MEQITLKRFKTIVLASCPFKFACFPEFPQQNQPRIILAPSIFLHCTPLPTPHPYPYM
jgi:hypothetical protein